MHQREQNCETDQICPLLNYAKNNLELGIKETKTDVIHTMVTQF